MKKPIASVLLFNLVMFAQGSKLQLNPMVDEPVSFKQVSDTHAWVEGNWIAMDEHSKLPGVSVSEISCDLAEKRCHELQANIVVVGNMFSVTPDDAEYTITRWNSQEIVAQNIGGICKVKNTIKFDRKNKRVYVLQTLSEPVNDLPKMSQDICNAVGQNQWELHEKTMYTVKQ